MGLFSSVRSGQRCDGRAYAQKLLRLRDPRSLCVDAARSKVWIGYLEYAIEHHADHLPSSLDVGKGYYSNYDLSWDPDSPRSVFTIATECQYGQLITRVTLGSNPSGGSSVGNPPPRRKR